MTQLYPVTLIEWCDEKIEIHDLIHEDQKYVTFGLHELELDAEGRL